MDPVNLKKLDSNHFAFECIKDLIGKPPTDGTQRLRKAADQFSDVLPLKINEIELGRGGFGTVYAGTYEGNNVAVKKIPIALMNHHETEDQKREVEEHIRLDHENVIKLLHFEEDKDVKYRYLVLELCAGTLTDYCDGNNYNGPELPPNGIVLYQIASGLHYIHSKKLVHRDVKPDNILVSITTPVQMKLSDFGLVKKVSSRGTFSQSKLKGTVNWMAPEMLELLDDDSRDSTPKELPHGTIQSDTFAAGCVFFYFLTGGKHPFGNNVTVPANILQNKPGNLMELVRQLKQQNMQSDDELVFLYNLIGKMIQKELKERMALPDVIKKLVAILPGKFKEVVMPILEDAGYCVSRFHPTDRVLACGVAGKVIYLSTADSSILFSYWKEDEILLQHGKIKEIQPMEWNMDGTQLAAICNSDECDVIVWSYPFIGEILFQMNLPKWMDTIEWNPFRPNVFAIFNRGLSFQFGGKKVFLLSSSPVVHQRKFHFCTIAREKTIGSVKWIAENRLALNLKNSDIEIWEIDESAATAKFVKRLGCEWITDMVWDERTKCLAACSWEGWIKIWPMDSEQPVHTLEVGGICCSLTWLKNFEKTKGKGMDDAARQSPAHFIWPSECI
ncbi:mitogen-activated protein kinase HOG1-like [Daphnia pulicaria]|uniref:mitogen-activated protein kinase HOG1-like n=1 Tax=Daphnia pulicaria TaxID=35523 RepID=UPI001EEB3FDD|nr:mitogen-activated protein kinase HOG1-like [Daphnia pulicaria]